MQEYLDEKVKKYTLSAPEKKGKELTNKTAILSTVLSAIVLLLLSIPVWMVWNALATYYGFVYITIWHVWISLGVFFCVFELIKTIHNQSLIVETLRILTNPDNYSDNSKT